MSNFSEYTDIGTLNQRKIEDLFTLSHFTKDDSQLLVKLHDAFNKDDLKNMIDHFYERLLSFDYAKSFFDNQNLLDRVKVRQATYFSDFFTSDYNEAFFQERRNLGTIHERIGLDNTWYLASYTIFFTQLVDMAKKKAKSTDEAFDIIKAMGKLILMDVGTVISSYLDARENIIKAQSQEVLELSSPVLNLTDDITIIPLLGTLDSVRALGIMDKILRSIEKSNTQVVILDITGVPLIDTSTGANLVRTVSAIHLMGSEVIVTGLSPKLASTIVELGIDLSALRTKSNLAQGLAEALKIVSST